MVFLNLLIELKAFRRVVFNAVRASKHVGKKVRAFCNFGGTEKIESLRQQTVRRHRHVIPVISVLNIARRVRLRKVSDWESATTLKQKKPEEFPHVLEAGCFFCRFLSY